MSGVVGRTAGLALGLLLTTRWQTTISADARIRSLAKTRPCCWSRGYTSPWLSHALDQPTASLADHQAEGRRACDLLLHLGSSAPKGRWIPVKS
ncbi:hypothetical protein PR003_g16459 [Phytophthora rubi]|uniref:RxLR effector protein n=1 Tax=Phytophthora rubi TaxID=129364 RepID=A0A6A4EGA1_9STRA|nr:hypothetical protein PR001_g15641 [Phytophthora rubi]KAE9325522.1 hypothetical protein PR003_g16459 [Phytophthora rubi]